MHLYHVLRVHPGGLLLLLFLFAGPVRAQLSTQLQLQTVRVDSTAPVELTFVDLGTGATNYQVEFRAGMEGSGSWLVDTNVTVIPEGNGSHRVQIHSPRVDRGFYRVVGLGGSIGPIVVEFSTVAFQITEGETALPMLILNQPFQGVVHYTVTGTAGSGDYLELSGQVTINGTTATIPVSLTDNESIGQLKFLTLRLAPGPGYELGAGTTATINIEENDADWQGSFVTENATVGFILNLRQLNGVHTAALKGDGTGLFTTAEVPATVVRTSTSFSADVPDIPIPAGSTLLNEPVSVSLFLEATNGMTNQTVSPTFITGAGTLVTRFPAQPHLNTTNTGTFSLMRPPAAPSTNQVELVPAL